MKLDLTEMTRTAGMRFVQEIDEPCPEGLEMDCTSNVKGNIKLHNTGSLLMIEGEIKTDIKLPCSRCLVDVAMPVQSTIEEQFEIERIGDVATILPLEEEDETERFVNNNVLDVDELVRQSLLLVLPIQPLCQPECMGLCPTCGENLNVRKCVCPPSDPESPFQVLADLLEEENDS